MKNFYAIVFRKTRINANFRKSRLAHAGTKDIAALNATSHVFHLTHGARLFEPSAQGPREGIAAEPRQGKRNFALPSGTEH